MDLLEKIAADYQRWSPVVFMKVEISSSSTSSKTIEKQLIYQLINI